MAAWGELYGREINRFDVSCSFNLPAIPISIDVDFDSNKHAGIAVGGAGGANSAQDL